MLAAQNASIVFTCTFPCKHPNLVCEAFLVNLQPGANGMAGGEGASARQVRKQGEALDQLQRKMATLESRFVDYQEAQAAMAQVLARPHELQIAWRWSSLYWIGSARSQQAH